MVHRPDSSLGEPTRQQDRKANQTRSVRAGPVREAGSPSARWTLGTSRNTSPTEPSASALFCGLWRPLNPTVLPFSSGGGEPVYLLARWWQHLGHLPTCEVGSYKNQQCERRRGDDTRQDLDDFENLCAYRTCMPREPTCLLCLHASPVPDPDVQQTQTDKEMRTLFPTELEGSQPYLQRGEEIFPTELEGCGQTCKEMREPFQQSLSQWKTVLSEDLQHQRHLVPASPQHLHSSRATLLLLEGGGKEGATHAPDEGDHSHLHQLLLEEGEGATPVQIPDDLKSTRICTAAMRLLASLYAIL